MSRASAQDRTTRLEEEMDSGEELETYLAHYEQAPRSGRNRAYAAKGPWKVVRSSSSTGSEISCVPRGGACGCCTCLNFLERHWRPGVEVLEDDEGVSEHEVRGERSSSGESVLHGRPVSRDYAYPVSEPSSETGLGDPTTAFESDVVVADRLEHGGGGDPDDAGSDCWATSGAQPTPQPAGQDGGSEQRPFSFELRRDEDCRSVEGQSPGPRLLSSNASNLSLRQEDSDVGTALCFDNTPGLISDCSGEQSTPSIRSPSFPSDDLSVLMPRYQYAATALTGDGPRDFAGRGEESIWAREIDEIFSNTSQFEAREERRQSRVRVEHRQSRVRVEQFDNGLRLLNVKKMRHDLETDVLASLLQKPQ